jgi:hypothetical protein
MFIESYTTVIFNLEHLEQNFKVVLCNLGNLLVDIPWESGNTAL